MTVGLDELRIKAAVIYIKLYGKANDNEMTLAELFETDSISLSDPRSSEYMELVMDMELIENQIRYACKAIERAYGY